MMALIKRIGNIPGFVIFFAAFVEQYAANEIKDKRETKLKAMKKNFSPPGHSAQAHLAHIQTRAWKSAALFVEFIDAEVEKYQDCLVELHDERKKHQSSQLSQNLAFKL